ncbi:MAG: SDR family oxidoreductase [Spirochaetes bacterium]|nr:SDR family oxidoreductase [Spirochaetota bacterium]
MFKDKIVVVTGGASGIGAATAREFGIKGARIGLLDFDKKMLEKTASELTASGIEVYPQQCDVTNEIHCVKAIKAVMRQFGGIDVLVNNAGITQRSLFRNTKVEVIRRVMDVNFFGSVHCTKAALESIIERKGTIIVVTSIAGIAPLYGRCGYSSSKHALHGFFESLRSELADLGVHVMMVSPGFTITNLQSRALDGDGSLNRKERSIPGSEATPESVAQAIYRGAVQKKMLLVLTTVGKASYLLARFFPSFYEKRMIKSVRSEFD